MNDHSKTANDNSPAKAAAVSLFRPNDGPENLSHDMQGQNDYRGQTNNNFHRQHPHEPSLNTLGRGDAIGRHKTAQERAYSAIDQAQHTSMSNAANRLDLGQDEQSKTQTGSNGGPPFSKSWFMGLFSSSTAIFVAMLCLWLGAIAALVFCLLAVHDTTLRVLAFIVCGWMSLGLSYVSKRHGRDFMADLGYSTLFSSLIGAIFAAKTGFNIPISLPLLICILAYSSAALSFVLKESYFLTLSIMLSLSWSACWFLNLETPLLYWTFPFLWAVQMLTGLRLRARLALGLIGLSGLLCLGVNLISMVHNDHISVLMAVCVLFAGGMTYARIGETLQDNDQTGGVFQTNFGWIVAALSALAIQDYWLTQNIRFPWGGLMDDHAPSFKKFPQWILFLVACVGLIFICNWSRMRQNLQGAWSSTALFLFASVLPASIVFQSQIIGFATKSGIAAKPVIGLLIGGAITGLAIAYLASGFAKGRKSTVLAAIFALSIEAILVMDILYQTPNNILIFGCAVFVIALTTGYIAQHPFGGRTARAKAIKGRRAGHV